MGLMPAVLANRVDERGVAMVNANGRRLNEMSADMFRGEGLVAEIEIARGDLARVLHDGTAAFTGYRFGAHVTALHQDAAGVDVSYASGDTDRFDIVVGADGVHSGVRALAFGPEQDFVRHLGAYTGYFTVPDPGDLDHWFLMYNAPGGRVVGLRPERGGTAKASLSFRSAHLGDHRLGVREQQRLLTDRMAGAGWKVDSLLAAMPGAPDFFFDSISQVRVERWSRGRVVLIGDAGYCGSPLAGLGTSMSLVGAYVLAGELAATPADPAAAFDRYQAEMADYVAAGLALPPGGISSFAPKTRTMIALRALSWRSMSHWPMRAVLEKQFTKAERITLKDYPGTSSAAEHA